MNLLVCAATASELAAFGLPFPADGQLTRCGAAGLLVTGVGIPLALASVLQAATRERPERILNIGIAGAYPRSGLVVGDIAVADSEIYGDVGMEVPEPPGFRPLRNTSFGSEYRDPFRLVPWSQETRTPLNLHGCTVNCCTGTDETGRSRENLFGADFETMEGAAVAQAGTLLGIPVCEIRAISNIAAQRDMRPENIRLALDNLTQFFQEHPPCLT